MRGGSWRLVALPLAAVALAVVAVAQESRPQIRVLDPAPNAEVVARDVTVRMKVSGVELAPDGSRMGAYIVLRLDDAPPVKSYTNRFTFQEVPVGQHVLRAELRRSDGTAYNPPARTQVRFSVRAPTR